MSTTGPQLIPEFALDVDRSDERDLGFEFAESVNATALNSLAGSSFTLTFFDAVGTSVLVVTAEPTSEAQVFFSVSAASRQILAPGKNGRFELVRTIAERNEVWGRGSPNVTGGARG